MEYEYKLLHQFTTTVAYSINRARATHRRATRSVFWNRTEQHRLKGSKNGYVVTLKTNYGELEKNFF